MAGHSKWNNIKGRKNAQMLKEEKYSKNYRVRYTWQQRVVDLIRLQTHLYD